MGQQRRGRALELELPNEDERGGGRMRDPTTRILSRTGAGGEIRREEVDSAGDDSLAK